MTTEAILEVQPQQQPIAPDADFSLSEFDRDCNNYVQWKQLERDAKEKADKIKARIMDAVEQHGQVPTNAEKSRRVEGRRYVATVTTGTAIEIDDQRCTDLELLLSRARKSNLFSQMFARRSEFTLVKGADQVIRTTAWPKKFRDEITSLYAACFRPKTKTPSLEVVSVESLQAKQDKAAKKSRGGKAAA